MIEGLVEQLLGKDPDQGVVGALGIALSVLAGILGYLVVSRPAARQALRIERSQAYLNLELASIEIFRYKAEKWITMQWLLDGKNRGIGTAQLTEEADQYAYQCLNLFEVASRFRKENIIDKFVYASWVAWFYEMLEVEYFRNRWPIVYVDNYTPELQRIFNAGIALWDAYPEPSEGERPEPGEVGPAGSVGQLRRKAFYHEVGRIIGCPIVYFWVDPELHRQRPIRQYWEYFKRRISGNAPL